MVDSKKAERIAKAKERNAPPLDVRTRDIPGLRPESSMRSVEYAKGIVRLSEFYGIGGPPPLFPPKEVEPRIHLMYESMSELESDHGMSTICGILMDADLWMISPKTREALLAQTKAGVSEHVWTMIDALMREPRSDRGGEDLRDYIAIGFWAEVCLEPLSDLWLAAMAQHAYYVERNDFAFGYLTAQLDHRRVTEEDYLRGRKSVLSGRAGAEARAKSRQHTTKRVLAEMGRLIDNGHSVSRAATIAANSGIGTSASANRKLWERHPNTAG